MFRQLLMFLAFVVGFLVLGRFALADTIEYSARASFDAASEDLTLEDFEEATVAAGASTLTAAPLDATTNDGVFVTGDIAAGLAISEYGSLSTPGQILVYGDGYAAGLDSTQVSFADCAQALHLFFDGGVTAFGLDLFHLEYNESIAVTLYAGSTSVHTTTLSSLTQGTTTFVGFTSDTSITRATFLPSDDLYFTADNIALGSASSAVPEPTSFGLLALGLVGVAWCDRRRRVRA